MTTFADVVDAADQLSADEQATLLEILRRRVAERNRERLLCEVKEARDEFSRGEAKIASVKEIMDEVRGET